MKKLLFFAIAIIAACFSFTSSVEAQEVASQVQEVSYKPLLGSGLIFSDDIVSVDTVKLRLTVINRNNPSQQVYFSIKNMTTLSYSRGKITLGFYGNSVEESYVIYIYCYDSHNGYKLLSEAALYCFNKYPLKEDEKRLVEGTGVYKVVKTKP